MAIVALCLEKQGISSMKTVKNTQDAKITCETRRKRDFKHARHLALLDSKSQLDENGLIKESSESWGSRK